MVDPIRFRFAGSQRLAKFFINLLPQIDFYIWISTPPSIAYSRKPEIPLASMIQQYEAYKSFLTVHTHSVAFNIGDSLQSVIDRLGSEIDKTCE
jgi:hypothetical protein